MKMLQRKVIQTSVALIGAVVIIGCGGGGGLNLVQNAIDMISDYAQSNTNPAPGNLDYSDAGITGVSHDNLDAVNAMIDKGVGSDYDTAAEIQALVNLIGAKAVPDRNFGDGEHDFIYGVVTNPTTGDTWLNNNLGARYADSDDPNFDPQQQATSPTDFLAYGSLFQWGRKADGHELINRTGPTTGTPKYGSITTQSIIPGHHFFIKHTSDWRSVPKDYLWSGSAINEVCPTGYRLPSQFEMGAEQISWGAPYSGNEAFGSNPAWTLAGYRDKSNAQLYSQGAWGYYWSSSTTGVMSYRMHINSGGSQILSTDRSWGLSVRCIKN